jgi:hypothetical protein
MASGRGRAYISLLNPHVILPHFYRVSKCDGCGTETVCREGAFSKELWRKVWLCWQSGEDNCCAAKAEREATA